MQIMQRLPATSAPRVPYTLPSWPGTVRIPRARPVQLRISTRPQPTRSRKNQTPELQTRPGDRRAWADSGQSERERESAAVTGGRRGDEMAKGFASYLAMKTGPEAGDSSAAVQALIDADLREIGVAARKLANHAFVLGGGLGFGTSFLRWLAFVAAV